MPSFLFMVRGSPAPDSSRRPVHDPPPERSPVGKHIRVTLKYLAVYGVTIVNGAAILYIMLRVWRYVTE